MGRILLNSILRFDKLLYDSINRGLYNLAAFWFFEAITNLADLFLAILFFYFVYLVLSGREKSGIRMVVLLLLLSATIAEAVTLVGKVLIPRGEPTPYVQPVLEFGFFPVKDYLHAFPSGHTSRVFALVTVLGQKYKRWRIVLFVFASLIGFSRIYIGAHYPLDVIAGAALGIGVSFIVLKIFRLKQEALDEKGGVS